MIFGSTILVLGNSIQYLVQQRGPLSERQHDNDFGEGGGDGGDGGDDGDGDYDEDDGDDDGDDDGEDNSVVDFATILGKLVEKRELAELPDMNFTTLLQLINRQTDCVFFIF